MGKVNSKSTITVGLTVLVLAALAALCHAADYRVRKMAEGLTFEIGINRNPPVVGDNAIRIEIRDSQGNPVQNAEVLVNYYMPPMPRMAPMNYTVPAAFKDGAYRAGMDLIMAGPWNIVIKAKNSGRWTQVAFPIDVR
jgi:hypothetical protein